MKAITISGRSGLAYDRRRPFPSLALSCLLAVRLAAAEPPNLSDYAQHAYEDARKLHEAAPSSPEAGWKLSKACFELGEFSKTHKERETLAQQGIRLARQVLKSQPQLAQAHYYLALNLGQLARTRTLTALSLVGEMEEAFQKTISLDAQIDFAGAYRNVALIYRDAPGWPISLGNRKKARECLQNALKLSPQYPGNQLTWLESLLKWEETDLVRQSLTSTASLLEKARQELKGDAWTASWVEWDERWDTIKKAAQKE